MSSLILLQCVFGTLDAIAKIEGELCRIENVDYSTMVYVCGRIPQGRRRRTPSRTVGIGEECCVEYVHASIKVDVSRGRHPHESVGPTVVSLINWALVRHCLEGRSDDMFSPESERTLPAELDQTRLIHGQVDNRRGC